MKSLSEFINESFEVNEEKTTVKDAFSYLAMLTPKENTSSSMGKYVSSLDQQMADKVFKEVADFIPDDTLAHKILFGNKTYTDKQRWVIAYELMKSKDFVKMMDERNAKKTEEEERERSQRQGKADFSKVKRALDKKELVAPKDGKVLTAEEIRTLEVDDVVGVKLKPFKPMVVGVVLDKDDKTIMLYVRGEKNRMVFTIDNCSSIYK